MRFRSIVALCAVAAVSGGGSASAGFYSPPPRDSRPTWSPDGSAIVFDRYAAYATNSPSGLFVVGPDGRGERQLPLVTGTTFSFSPDWYRIAIPQSDGTTRRLAIMRPDGSGRIAFGEPEYNAQVTWSPDGARLAFDQRDGIYVADADGSGLRFLVSGSSPAWSPRGNRVAYSTGATIEVVDPDGSHSTTVISGGGHYAAPAWSPDGQSLVFRRQDTSTSRGAFVVARADGYGVVRELPTGGDAAWSPNSRSVAVGGSAVRVYDFDTKGVHTLAPDGFDVSWSPDGRSIAYAAGGECRDRVGIYRYDLARDQATRITNDCKLFGTNGADVITGTPLADDVLGLAGDDRLTGASRGIVGDTLEGGSGSDVLTGTTWPDTLDGGADDDVIRGGFGGDFITGGSGHDVVDAAGGNDTIYVNDGERDVVACGTNNSPYTRRTEGDQVYADSSDAIARDCEYVFRPGRVAAPRGRTRLAVRVTAAGARPHAVYREYTLRCAPEGGTLPHAAAACKKLAALRNPFAPVPVDAVCTQIYSGPQLARVTGVYGGRIVDSVFSRRDGCQTARWDRLRFLFPVSTGA